MADASRTARSDDGMDLEITEAKQKASASLQTEVARCREMHTLAEHHEHLLSASFDLSNGSGGALGPSPSQVSLDFAFDNNFLNPSSGLLDFGGLGDELEKELGWGPSQAENEELSVWPLSASLYQDLPNL
jgi:meiotic recombination protein REC8